MPLNYNKTRRRQIRQTDKAWKHGMIQDLGSLIDSEIEDKPPDLSLSQKIQVDVGRSY